jgi:serine-type D-Ala-D-Ala carboxypeptidase (penicillin-binding protein 5/6)
MSTAPPFMTPGRSARRRTHAARRRRRRRLLSATAFALCAVAGAAVALVLDGSSGRGTHHARAVTSRAAAKPDPARSPTGLALAKPAFDLRGIATPALDPVKLYFHAPPRAGLLFDLSSGRVLWQRNPYRQMPIASLTKMMTVLLAVTSAPPSTPILVTKEAVASAGSKVGVLPLGRHVRLESMLYGLMLPSGNDAAVAIAQHLAGSVKRFVARMNAKAAELGMGCTRYSSPSGYYDQGNFSCAADLAMLAHVDLEQRRIARVAHTYRAVLPFPIKGGKLYLGNNNPLLIYGYPGVTGLKTGYTLAAGRCLVATAERHGVRLGVVLLHSPDPATQAKKLLDRAFDDVYGLEPVSEPPIPDGA